MKRFKTMIALVLVAALLFSGGFPGGSIDRVQAATTYNWGSLLQWAGGSPSDSQGFKWSYAELWWYGRAKVFSYNATIEYFKEGANNFWIKGTGDNDPETPSYFGAIAEWGTPLDIGYNYVFRMFVPKTDQVPDKIVINDDVVWEMTEGYEFGVPKVIEFTYIPETHKEIANIALVGVLGEGETKTIYPPNHSNLEKSTNPTEICLVSRRQMFSGTRPDYPQFALPEGTNYESLPSHLAADLLYDEYFTGINNYNGYTLPKLPYPTAETKVEERWLPADIAGSKYYPVNKTDIATFQPGATGQSNFEIWSNAVKASGTTEIALTPVIEEIHVSTDIVANPRAGHYTFGHLTAPIAGKWNWDQFVNDMGALAAKWLEMVPNGKVWIFDVEANSAYGPYMGGIKDSQMKNFPGYGSIANGGSNAWNLAFKFHKDEYFGRIKAKAEALGADASKIYGMANFDRATFQGAYGYKEGADVIFHKNIHRQSANVVTANSRGAAEAYDKQYGYDFDNWDRQYSFSYTPEELTHILKLYFHSGADYLMDEISTWDYNTNKITTMGRTWIEFWHYAKTHPKLGEQKVNIGIMRGLGDEWSGVGGQSASWEGRPWFPTPEMSAAFSANPVPQKWARADYALDQNGSYKTQDTYFQDYNLLNLVFSNFGNSYLTKSDRLVTGTPYGPVNFLPWDTSVSKLGNYDVVMYFGRGTGITQQEADNLAAYVNNGGKLVMAAGQLRKEDNTFITDNFLGAQLGEEKLLNGIPYTLLTAESGQVAKTLSNGDPAALKVTAGSGELYLLAGEWLTYWDNQPSIWESSLTTIWENTTAGSVIKPLLEEAKLLNFITSAESAMDASEAADWLEYTLQNKGNTRIIPVFNHGRGLTPSGNGLDRGAWTGTITADLDELGLGGQTVSVYKANYDRNYDPSASLPVTLEPVTFNTVDDQLRIDITIEELEELVVGPSASVVQEYFGITDYSPITGITLDVSSEFLYPQDTVQLNAAVETENQANVVLDWSSDDNGVASVDENGLVTANNIGEATITVRVADAVTGQVFSAQSVVTVTSRFAPFITYDFDNETLNSTTATGWTLKNGKISEVSGDKYVELNKTASGAGNQATAEMRLGGLTGHLVLDAQVYIADHTAIKQIYVKNASNELMFRINLEKTATKKITVTNGSSTAVDSTKTYSAGKWMPLRIEWDTSTSTYQLSLDGVNIGSYSTIAPVTGTRNIDYVQIQMNNTSDTIGTLYFDDVIVSKPAEPITGVSLDDAIASVQVGGSLDLVASVEPLGASGYEISWNSSDPSIAAVDQMGNVTALHEGTAIVEVTVNDTLYGTEFKDQCTIQVVPVRVLHFDDGFDGDTAGNEPAGWSVILNGSLQNSVLINEHSGDKFVTMTKTEKSLTVTAKKEFSTLTGRVIIETDLKVPSTNQSRIMYVQNENGESIMKFALWSGGLIRAANGSTAWIDTPATYSMNTWYKLTIDLDTTTGMYDFYVNGSKLATYAVMPGFAINVGKLQYNLQNANTDVFNIDNVKAYSCTAISLDSAETLYLGDILQMNPTVHPLVSETRTVNWESDDEAIATVDDNGNVTAHSAGTTKIHARVTDSVYGPAAAECDITVEAAAPVTEVDISIGDTRLEVGQSVQLTAETTPAGATYQGVNWSSSDEAVATVDINGNVTAVGEGAATITAASKQPAELGNISDSIMLTVISSSAPVEPVTAIEISASGDELEVGQSLQLTATTTPDAATFKGIVWTSNNENIATVDSTGNVRGIGAGQATITASSSQAAEYGVVSDSVTITVTAPAEEPGEEPGEEPTPDPDPSPEPSPSPSPSPQPSPSPEPSPSPSPSPTPSPEPEDINDKLEKIIEKDGTKTAKLDEKNLKALEKALEKEAKLELKAGDGSDKQNFEAPAELFSKAKDKSAEIGLDYGNVKMTIPADAIDLDKLAKDLGLSAMDKASVQISVKETESPATGVGENHQPAGKTFEFNFIVQTLDGKTSEITAFKQPVKVQIPVEEHMAEPVIKGTRNVYKVDVNPPQYRYTYKEGGNYFAELTGFSSYALLDYSNSFSDVGNSHWAKDYVQAAAAKAITVGIGNNRFGPDRNVTRSEFAVFIVKALNIKLDSYNGIFKDIPSNVWYGPYVEAAYRSGIVAGIGGGRFAPDSSITREQMAAMVMRAYSMVTGKDLAAEANGFKGSISYLKGASSYSLNAIMAAYANGIMDAGIEGITNASFLPEAVTERDQAVAALIRLLEKLGKL